MKKLLLSALLFVVPICLTTSVYAQLNPSVQHYDLEMAVGAESYLNFTTYDGYIVENAYFDDPLNPFVQAEVRNLNAGGFTAYLHAAESAMLGQMVHHALHVLFPAIFPGGPLVTLVIDIMVAIVLDAILTFNEVRLSHFSMFAIKMKRLKIMSVLKDEDCLNDPVVSVV